MDTMTLDQGVAKVMYQVITKDGMPASNEFDWMCIFPTIMLAGEYLSYLVNECCQKIEEYKIRRVYVELV